MEENRNEVYTDENGTRVVPAGALRKVVSHRHIVLADGTDIDGGRCALNDDDDTLWIWVEKDSGYSLMSLFPIFSDTSKTQKIESWFLDSEDPTVYEGYTELINIHTENSGRIEINLRHS